MRDSLKIVGGTRNEKREITGSYILTRRDRDKYSDWGRDGGIEPKIAARCEIEKSYHNVGPSEMMENIKTVIMMRNLRCVIEDPGKISCKLDLIQFFQLPKLQASIFLQGKFIIILVLPSGFTSKKKMRQLLESRQNVSLVIYILFYFKL